MKLYEKPVFSCRNRVSLDIQESLGSILRPFGAVARGHPLLCQNFFGHYRIPMGTMGYQRIPIWSCRTYRFLYGRIVGTVRREVKKNFDFPEIFLEILVHDSIFNKRRIGFKGVQKHSEGLGLRRIVSVRRSASNGTILPLSVFP